ncbi:MAG: hypothetical protein Q8K75_06090 [Chlamydiales bacterium]|nr:hypothetical protein [Chlamydiales bacterium]
MINYNYNRARLFGDLYCKLQDQHSLRIGQEIIRQTINEQVRIVLDALDTNVDLGRLQGVTSINITGSLVPFLPAFPLDVFQPFIELEAKKLGVTIEFAPVAQTARFLARDFTYHPMKIHFGKPGLSDLNPTESSALLGGGSLTGYARHLHILKHLRHMENVSTAALIGPGMQKSPEGQNECPQLTELATVTSPDTKFLVVDNCPKIIKTLEKRACYYSRLALETLEEYNDLDESYQELIRDMAANVTEMPTNVEFVCSDLTTHVFEPASLDVVVATYSISNVFRLFDYDPIETEKMLNILGAHINALRLGGVLYTDKGTLSILEDRFFEESEHPIEEIIMPYLSFHTQSTLSLELLEAPIETVKWVDVRAERTLGRDVRTSSVYIIKKTAEDSDPDQTFFRLFEQHRQRSVQ